MTEADRRITCGAAETCPVCKKRQWFWWRLDGELMNTDPCCPDCLPASERAMLRKQVAHIKHEYVRANPSATRKRLGLGFYGNALVSLRAKGALNDGL